MKNVNPGKPNLSTIVHDLKLAFKRKFGDSQKLDGAIEMIINLSAPRVKAGEIAEWDISPILGLPMIKFSKPPKRRFFAPKAIGSDGHRKSNPNKHS